MIPSKMEYLYDIEAVDYGITITGFEYKDDYHVIAMARQELEIEIGLERPAIGKIRIFRTGTYGPGQFYKIWKDPELIHES